MFRLQGIDYTSLGDMLEHDRVGAGPVDKRDKSRLLILGEFLSLASNEDFLQLCILISSLPAPAQINLWKCELNLLSPERWEMLFDAFMQHNTISSIDLCNNNLAKLGIDFWKHFPALTRSRTQPLTLSLWKNGLEKLDPACWESLCNAIENSRCPLTLVLRDNQLDEFSPTQWVRLCHAIQNCTSPLSLDLRERNTYCRDSHSSRPARPILVEHPFTSQQFIQLEEAIRRSPIVNIRVHNAEQHQKLQLIVRERQRTFLKSLLRFNFEGNAASERVGILPLEVLSIINQAVGLPDESSTSKMPAPMLSCDLNEYGCEHFVPLAEANDLVGLEAACQREWAIHGDILWHHCSEEPSAALKCAAHTAIQLGHIEIINYLFEKRLMFETGDELMRHAAGIGSLPIVKLYKAYGGSFKPSQYEINEIDHILISAVKAEQVHIVEYLLQEGANASLFHHFHPYHNTLRLAALAGNTKILELLMAYGAASIVPATLYQRHSFGRLPETRENYKKIVRNVLDHAIGVDFPVVSERGEWGSKSGLDFLQDFNDDISDLNFIGMTVGGQPITHEMLARLGFQGAERAIITIGDLRYKSDPHRVLLDARLHTLMANQGGSINSDGTIHIGSVPTQGPVQSTIWIDATNLGKFLNRLGINRHEDSLLDNNQIKLDHLTRKQIQQLTFYLGEDLQSRDSSLRLTDGTAAKLAFIAKASEIAHLHLQPILKKHYVAYKISWDNGFYWAHGDNNKTSDQQLFSAAKKLLKDYTNGSQAYNLASFSRFFRYGIRHHDKEVETVLSDTTITDVPMLIAALLKQLKDGRYGGLKNPEKSDLGRRIQFILLQYAAAQYVAGHTQIVDSILQDKNLSALPLREISSIAKKPFQS